MVKILWISRHPPLEAQKKELERKLGKIEIEVRTIQINSAEEIAEIVKKEGFDYIVPVLPIYLIGRLAELLPDRVLQAEMTTITSGPRDTAELFRLAAPERRSIVCYSDNLCRVYEFKEFRKVKRLVLETEPL